MSEDRCVICGDIIPEGRQYCLTCYRKIMGEDKGEKMLRLIDAELLTEHLFANIEHDKTVDDEIIKSDKEAFAFKCGWNDALISVMENAPTIDAVEVVRCKDCIYQVECAFTEWLGRNGNGFCSCGERREDA